MGEKDAVAVMARNHRGFVEATVAVAKLGADLIYLNTAFSGPQLVDVLEREGPVAVIHDEEFAGMLEKVLGRSLARRHTPARAGDVRDTLADIRRAREGLGYAPAVDFGEGLRRTVAAFKA